MATASFQVLVDSDEEPPEPLFETEEDQLPQLFLTDMFSKPFRALLPSLDTLQPLSVLCKVRGPDMDTALKVRPHQCRVQAVVTALLLPASPFLFFCEKLALQGPLQCMAFHAPRAAARGQGDWIWRIWGAECPRC